MKLKILKNVVLADNVVSNPHMTFKKNQIIKTDNEYVIDTLLGAKYATIIDKKSNAESLVEETKAAAAIEAKKVKAADEAKTKADAETKEANKK